MGGIAQAFGDNVPILLLPGGSPLSAWSVRPNFSPARAYAPISKQTEAIFTASEVGNAMRRAFHALRNGSGGPVTVETPADVMAADVPDEVIDGYRSPKRSVMSPSRSDVKDAVKVLLEANNPVLWLAAESLFASASEELERTGRTAGRAGLHDDAGRAFPETHRCLLARAPARRHGPLASG